MYKIVEETIKKLTDPVWYGENIAGLIVFSIFVGFVIKISTWLGNRQYMGWKFEVYEHSNSDEARETPIYWEDVKRMLSDRIELFTKVRHIVGSYRWINTQGAEQALNKSKWLKINEKQWLTKWFSGGSIDIHLPVIPAAELKDGCWSDNFRPRGWIGDTANNVIAVTGHKSAQEWFRKQDIDAKIIDPLGQSYTSTFRTDGTSKIAFKWLPGMKFSGRWEISGDEICMQYPAFFMGRRYCDWIYIDREKWTDENPRYIFLDNFGLFKFAIERIED